MSPGKEQLTDDRRMVGARFLTVGVRVTQGEDSCPGNPRSQLPGKMTWGVDWPVEIHRSLQCECPADVGTSHLIFPPIPTRVTQLSVICQVQLLGHLMQRMDAFP